jgi:hypothetical protein
MCWVTWFASTTWGGGTAREWSLGARHYLDHYQYAPDADYGTVHEAVSHNFWVSIFFMHTFFHYPSVLIHFLLHILFCSYIFGCPKRATTISTHLRSLTELITRS